MLAIVAEQTGYPPDMLDLDLDLEADLGIDTVKQAEMFAAIRAEYGIERDECLPLRDYPTLARGLEFVTRRSRSCAAAGAGRHGRAQAGAAPGGCRPPRLRVPLPWMRSPTRVLAIVAEQTGYPPDMLELDLDLEADLGIDTVKQAEMFAAIRGEFGIERDECAALRDYPTLASVAGFRAADRRHRHAWHCRRPRRRPSPATHPEQGGRPGSAHRAARR